MRVGVSSASATVLSGSERCRRAPIEPGVADEFAHETVAVGMDARRLETDQRVADRDIGAGQNLMALDGADSKTS